MTLNETLSSSTLYILRGVGIFGFLLNEYYSLKKFLEPNVYLAVMPHSIQVFITFVYIGYDTFISLYLHYFSFVMKIFLLFVMALKYFGVVPMQNIHIG